LDIKHGFGILSPKLEGILKEMEKKGVIDSSEISEKSLILRFPYRDGLVCDIVDFFNYFYSNWENVSLILWPRDSEGVKGGIKLARAREEDLIREYQRIDFLIYCPDGSIIEALLRIERPEDSKPKRIWLEFKRYLLSAPIGKIVLVAFSSLKYRVFRGKDKIRIFYRPLEDVAGMPIIQISILNSELLKLMEEFSNYLLNGKKFRPIREPYIY